MNIRTLPPDFGPFERFNVTYERKHFCHTATNHQRATIDLDDETRITFTVGIR